MKAMILAAGFGTRLGEITANTPKCLLEAGGQSMLERTVIRLKAAGVTEIAVNTHYLAASVEEFLREADFGVSIRLFHEEQILGTGGGINNARSFLDGDAPFFVHNCDIYSEADLAAMLSFHRSRQSPVGTLGVVSARTASRLLCSEEGLLQGLWKEGQEPYPKELLSRTFSGIYLLSPQIFNYMDQTPSCFSILDPIMKAVNEGRKIYTYDLETSFWTDIGTPDSLAALRERLG